MTQKQEISTESLIHGIGELRKRDLLTDEVLQDLLGELESNAPERYYLSTIIWSVKLFQQRIDELRAAGALTESTKLEIRNALCDATGVQREKMARVLELTPQKPWDLCGVTKESFHALSPVAREVFQLVAARKGEPVTTEELAETIFGDSKGTHSSMIGGAAFSIERDFPAIFRKEKGDFPYDGRGRAVAYTWRRPLGYKS